MALASNWSPEMRFKASKSITASMTKLVFGTAFTISLIFSLLVILYAWVIEDNIFNRLVAAEAQKIEATWLAEARVIQPGAAFMRLYDNWADLPGEIYSVWLKDPERVEFTLESGRTIHLKVLKPGGRTLILVADVAKFEVTRDFMSGATTWLAVFALICCMAVSTAAWWFAKRQMRPMDTLVKALERSASHPIRPGFAENYPDNEVKLLAKTIENQFLALDAALQRETNFTRDVSHEIRTPVSIQKNILEKRRLTASLTDDELTLLRDTNFQLESITNTLLALARGESTQSTTVNASELLENVILRHFELNHSQRGQALELDLNIENDVSLEANHQLLEILLHNLISNALQYTVKGPVKIALNENALRFENCFDEIPPNRFTQAGSKGEKSQGIGQGLSLIARICQSANWQFSASTRKNHFIVVIGFT